MMISATIRFSKLFLTYRRRGKPMGTHAPDSPVVVKPRLRCLDICFLLFIALVKDLIFPKDKIKVL